MLKSTKGLAVFGKYIILGGSIEGCKVCAIYLERGDRRSMLICLAPWLDQGCTIGCSRDRDDRWQWGKSYSLIILPRLRLASMSVTVSCRGQDSPPGEVQSRSTASCQWKHMLASRLHISTHVQQVSIVEHNWGDFPSRIITSKELPRLASR